MPSKKNPRNKNRRGFSLIELLLAASLVPVVSLVIFSNIASGMRLWQAVNRSIAEEDLCILREKIASDFSKAFKFSSIPFVGEASLVSFASSIEAPAALGGERGIGQVTFSYDDSKKVLIKQESHWSELYSETPPKGRVLFSGIKSFHAEYFYFDDNNSDYVWDAGWDSSRKFLPIAVRFVMEREGALAPDIFTFPIRSGS
jgi:prepilin-type N-terminal cleavage/methylation domain-containing protein